MFVTYPIEATADNWIHDCIFSVFKTICDALDNGETLPAWPKILPTQHQNSLSSKRTLPKLIKLFEAEAAKLTNVDRANFIRLFVQQNLIAGLLNGSVVIPVITNELKSIIEVAKAVCDEGFLLLTKTGVRDQHYSVIWDNLKSKTCPFCGIEPFDSPKLHREDEDHYLARSIYPLSAANFHNLVPMGSKCNERYKGQIDILHNNGNRRKAFNPYGIDCADIILLNSIIGGADRIPEWQIDLVPDTEETQTWEDVFSIRIRLTENALNPYYFDWLGEIPDWFSVSQINEQINNDNLLKKLEEFAAYKSKHKEPGIGFLKHKVIEMLVHHFRQGNEDLIAMIRSSLPKQSVIS
ncbi:MAG: hypothetical protein RIQ94_2014 [Pseudomonadota bacterium]|jgi:hypothetical protein